MRSFFVVFPCAANMGGFQKLITPLMDLFLTEIDGLSDLAGFELEHGRFFKIDGPDRYPYSP
jgi:hypothetical protein